jgi:hypothetical protein
LGFSLGTYVLAEESADRIWYAWFGAGWFYCYQTRQDEMSESLSLAGVKSEGGFMMNYCPVVFAREKGV